MFWLFSCGFFLKLMLSVFIVFCAGIFALKLYYEPKKGRCRCTTDLTGKVALVTGGNSGIGFETAKALVKRGAKVIIACRDADKSFKAITKIRRITERSDIQFLPLDLSKLSSIRHFAAEFNKFFPRLDILVNNAGCAGAPKKLTTDGIDLVMQVNYLGPFLLTNLLLDKLKENQPSRIVIVSSKAHHYAVFDPEDMEHNRFDSYWTRYANSKLCNVLWARALSKRLPEGVTVNALHPGLVLTDIFHKMSRFYRYLAWFVIGAFFKSAEEGAQTSIHLCLDPALASVTGQYFAECKVSDVSENASNDELVERVWERSVLLTRDQGVSDN